MLVSRAYKEKRATGCSRYFFGAKPKISKKGAGRKKKQISVFLPYNDYKNFIIIIIIIYSGSGV
jgi:hypothetical protein